MRKLLLLGTAFFLFQGALLLADSFPTNQIDATAAREPWVTTVTLEHAVTPKQRKWGLMGRRALAENHGMTFNFPTAQQHQFWMFNTLIDLSLAYLDSDKVIRELHELKANPEKMDPKRPVRSSGDVRKYKGNDPIVAFFLRHAVAPAGPVQYALEMPSGWFAVHGVRTGDVALWNTALSTGTILHTLSLEHYTPTEEMLVLLELPGNDVHSVWAPHPAEGKDIAFFTAERELISKHSLPSSTQLPQDRTPVAISEVPAKYILVAPEGWFTYYDLQRLRAKGKQLFAETTTHQR